ncbi:MAG: SHOCT domain-containing protein [Saccharofermentanales bacterium]
MIFIWIALVIGAYYLLKNNGKLEFGGQDKNNAIDVLKHRYAKGEISDDEYERMYKILKN